MAPDGIWQFGPARLLTVVGVGYLTVVLALAAVTLELDAEHPTSASRSPGTGAMTEGQGDDGPSAPAVPPSPVTPVGGGDVRVGSAQTRPATPPATPPAARPPVVPRPTTPAARPVLTSYEAESAANGLENTRIYTCSGCSGQKKVGNIGRGMGTLRFNGVTARTGGSAAVTIAYVNGESPRVGQVSVNGGPAITLTFPGTGGWSSVGAMVVTVALRPGPNTLTMFNPNSAAPDFDKITVSVR
ncbi:hypothetical protein EV384_4845 [Micromonospora kangleipakensis]|uniref:CBM6 domain-containing protein n=1 Tax=Micromonospora kangleipakensis TaxID=1077942 RepID=A0A4Q8BE61_9ACTN|nr:hypothetical protein [Micromonospora kangleipakensis]RZU76212.1 hypothetical protein EV384_4845 [Micromonospora kangleipakensis]